MKISAFRTDENLEVEGVWVDIGDGGKVKVARLGNPNHRKVSQALGRPHQAQIRANRLRPEVAEKLGIQATAQAILLDWEGITDDDGKPVPYSQGKALDLLTEFKDFRDLVLEIAGEMETFREQEIEESVGNSGSASVGKSSGGKK